MNEFKKWLEENFIWWYSETDKKNKRYYIRYWCKKRGIKTIELPFSIFKDKAKLKKIKESMLFDRDMT